MSFDAQAAAYLAIAAFAAGKGGGGDDALLMWNWMYAKNMLLPNHPLQAYQQLEEAWRETRPA